MLRWNRSQRDPNECCVNKPKSLPSLPQTKARNLRAVDICSPVGISTQNTASGLVECHVQQRRISGRLHNSRHGEYSMMFPGTRGNAARPIWKRAISSLPLFSPKFLSCPSFSTFKCVVPSFCLVLRMFVPSSLHLLSLWFHSLSLHFQLFLFTFGDNEYELEWKQWA